MAKVEVPTAVLATAVGDVIGDDAVRAAVFCTYTFEPTFFEDHVLAPLLGVAEGGDAAVRRMNLEEALREVEDVLVVYDPAGLRVGGGPLRQGVRAVPVRPPSGCAHAKHVLLVVEREGARDLVLVTTSANLTQAGWWRNVEVADVRRITGGSRTPLKEDLSDLLDDLSDLSELSRVAGGAIEAVRDVVDGLRQGSGWPRLWTGRQSLSSFLGGHVERGAKLELVSPFTDEEGLPVRTLVTALKPRGLRVMQPVDELEQVTAGPAWHATVKELGGRLGSVPFDRSLGRRASGNRFVHAKVIRGRKEGEGWSLIGSPNLSNPGHAGWRTDADAANFETAILVESPATRWLKGGGEAQPPAEQAVVPPEEEPRRATTRIRLRFDWAASQGFIQATIPAGEEVFVGGLGQSEGATLARWQFTMPAGEGWRPLGPVASAALAGALETSNLWRSWRDGEEPSTVLVEEEGFEDRPSRVTQGLTPSQRTNWIIGDVCVACGAVGAGRSVGEVRCACGAIGGWWRRGGGVRGRLGAAVSWMAEGPCRCAAGDCTWYHGCRSIIATYDQRFSSLRNGAVPVQPGSSGGSSGWASEGASGPSRTARSV